MQQCTMLIATLCAHYYANYATTMYSCTHVLRLQWYITYAVILVSFCQSTTSVHQLSVSSNRFILLSFNQFFYY